MILTRTPVRVSFLGGGSDYPEYFSHSDGAVLGMTIDKFAYISVNPISHCSEYKFRIGYSRLELVNAVDEIRHPSVRECLKSVGVDQPLDISLVADLPANSGLGSSSSFTVGLLNALHRVKGDSPTPHELALEAIHVERERLGEAVGCQDQFHAAFGGLNFMTFSEQAINVHPLSIAGDRQEAIRRSVMLFFSGQSRLGTEVAKTQMENTKKHSQDLYLKQMREMAQEGRDLITRGKPSDLPKALGELIWKGWQAKKHLSDRISLPSVDEALERARAAGAFGGKLLGAGGGGFLLVIAPEGRRDNVRRALSSFKEVKIDLSSGGSVVLYDDTSNQKLGLPRAA